MCVLADGKKGLIEETLPKSKSEERVFVRKDVEEGREHGVELVERADRRLLAGRHAATAAKVIVFLVKVGHFDV
jgi:hypothetical protein